MPDFNQRSQDNFHSLEARLDNLHDIAHKVLTHLEGPPGESERGLLMQVAMLARSERERAEIENNRRSLTNTLALTTIGSLFAAGLSWLPWGPHK